MEVVFFIYGLAFFVLGLAITLYPKNQSEFKLAKRLYLIAGFGLLHGINEWLDLFIIIYEGKADSVAIINILQYVKMVTLPISFLFLVEFGIGALASNTGIGKRIRFVTPGLFIIWLAVFLVGTRTPLTWDIWSRYLFCVPGGILTAVGLMMHKGELEKSGYKAAIRNLKFTVFIFLLYAALAGIVVKKADFFPASIINYDLFQHEIGIPVQVFRGGCALLAAFCIIRMMSIFDWESRVNLFESRIRFSSIADNAPVILFITDKEGIITFARGMGLTIVGLSTKEITGKAITDIIPDAPRIRENMNLALNGGQLASVERLDGSLFQISFAPLKDEDSQIKGVIGVAIDVTEKMNVQQEVDSYRDEIMRLKQQTLVGTVGQNMAEEIGQPLAVSRVLLERMIADLRGEPGGHDLHKRAKDTLAEITKAVDAIDEFYKKVPLERKSEAEPIGLYETVKKIVAVFRENALRARLEISLEGIDIVPCVRISKRELEQVFFVLIQNAIEAAGGEHKTSLAISCGIVEDVMELTFSDTCGGMEPEMVKRVFDPFASAGRKDMGLGLAVVKGILDSHDGSIDIESETGVGTTFRIRIPIEDVY